MSEPTENETPLGGNVQEGTLTARLEAMRDEVTQIRGGNAQANLYDLWAKLIEWDGFLPGSLADITLIKDAILGIWNIPQELAPETGETVYSELYRHSIDAIAVDLDELKIELEATNSAIADMSGQIANLYNKVYSIEAVIAANVPVIKTGVQAIAGAMGSLGTMLTVLTDLRDCCREGQPSNENTPPPEFTDCGQWQRVSSWYDAGLVSRDSTQYRVFIPYFDFYVGPPNLDMIVESGTGRQAIFPVAADTIKVCVCWNWQGGTAPETHLWGVEIDGQPWGYTIAIDVGGFPSMEPTDPVVDYYTDTLTRDTIEENPRDTQYLKLYVLFNAAYEGTPPRNFWLSASEIGS